MKRIYATQAQVTIDHKPHNLRYRFGYQIEGIVPLRQPTQIMEHNLLDTTMLYTREMKQDLQQNVEKISWI